MLSINNDVIKMTKGDTGIFEITIFIPPGNKIYNLQHNDKVVFYLSKTPCMSQGTIWQSLENSPNKKKEFILIKEFENKIIKIESQDTTYLKPNLYYWKCELVYANGEVSSICGGRFYLTCEA